MKLVLVLAALIAVGCSEKAKPSYVCIDGFVHEQKDGASVKLNVKCAPDGSVDGK